MVATTRTAYRAAGAKASAATGKAPAIKKRKAPSKSTGRAKAPKEADAAAAGAAAEKDWSAWGRVVRGAFPEMEARSWCADLSGEDKAMSALRTMLTKFEDEQTPEDDRVIVIDSPSIVFGFSLDPWFSRNKAHTVRLLVRAAARGQYIERDYEMGKMIISSPPNKDWEYTLFPANNAEFVCARVYAADYNLRSTQSHPNNGAGWTLGGLRKAIDDFNDHTESQLLRDRSFNGCMYRWQLKAADGEVVHAWFLGSDS